MQDQSVFLCLFLIFLFLGFVWLGVFVAINILISIFSISYFILFLLFLSKFFFGGNSTRVKGRFGGTGNGWNRDERCKIPKESIFKIMLRKLKKKISSCFLDLM